MSRGKPTWGRCAAGGGWYRQASGGGDWPSREDMGTDADIWMAKEDLDELLTRGKISTGGDGEEPEDSGGYGDWPEPPPTPHDAVYNYRTQVALTLHRIDERKRILEGATYDSAVRRLKNLKALETNIIRHTEESNPDGDLLLHQSPMYGVSRSSYMISRHDPLHRWLPDHGGRTDSLPSWVVFQLAAQLQHGHVSRATMLHSILGIIKDLNHSVPDDAMVDRAATRIFETFGIQLDRGLLRDVEKVGAFAKVTDSTKNYIWDAIESATAESWPPPWAEAKMAEEIGGGNLEVLIPVFAVLRNSEREIRNIPGWLSKMYDDFADRYAPLANALDAKRDVWLQMFYSNPQMWRMVTAWMCIFKPNMYQSMERYMGSVYNKSPRLYNEFHNIINLAEKPDHITGHTEW
jgi:hypothetical protein